MPAELESLLPKDPIDPLMKGRICKRCEDNFNLTKDELTVDAKVGHCDECGVCVMEIDHHCMFFDGCIGRNNMCLFGSVICGFFMVMIFCVICAAASGAYSKPKNLSVVFE